MVCQLLIMTMASFSPIELLILGECHFFLYIKRIAVFCLFTLKNKAKNDRNTFSAARTVNCVYLNTYKWSCSIEDYCQMSSLISIKYFHVNSLSALRQLYHSIVSVFFILDSFLGKIHSPYQVQLILIRSVNHNNKFRKSS